MKEIIKKVDNNLEIKLIIPLEKDRYCPYEDKVVGTMDSIIGLIDNRMSEYGFAHMIDMAYKDKGDQFTSCFYFFNGNEDEFIKLCKKIKINIIRI